MTSASLVNDHPSGSAPDHAERVRLRLKPKASTTTGFVDGGWWPRSRDLPAELPALVKVLAIRLGPVERVSYQLSDWDRAPRRIVVGGTLVHVEGYRLRPPGTIDVLGGSQRVTLLVVPPETEPELAHRALVAAGHRGNTDGVAALLTTPEVPDGADAADQGWDDDGGAPDAHRARSRRRSTARR
jgi:hypothetical protein